jgi:hypothetical protein
METISASVIPKEGHVRRVEWRTDLLVVDKLAQWHSNAKSVLGSFKSALARTCKAAQGRGHCVLVSRGRNLGRRVW